MSNMIAPGEQVRTGGANSSPGFFRAISLWRRNIRYLQHQDPLYSPDDSVVALKYSSSGSPTATIVWGDRPGSKQRIGRALDAIRDNLSIHMESMGVQKMYLHDVAANSTSLACKKKRFKKAVFHELQARLVDVQQQYRQFRAEHEHRQLRVVQGLSVLMKTHYKEGLAVWRKRTNVLTQAKRLVGVHKDAAQTSPVMGE